MKPLLFSFRRLMYVFEISKIILQDGDSVPLIQFTYAATCSATKSMSTKSSSFSELDSSSSAKVSRIPGEGNVTQSF